MKVKKTVPLEVERLISYQTDEYSLILLAISSGQTMIFTVDPETMAPISSFPINTEINEHYRICVDDNCVYFPTKFGQILAMDKFSGEILSTLNPSMPIVADLEQDESSIYSVCGVPISKKWKLSTENYCVCIFDKETGKKRVQTSYFGKPNFLVMSESHFWVVSGTYLYKYKKEGDLEKRVDLSVPIEYRPILVNNQIIFCYPNGTIRILNQDDLSFHSILQTQKCISHPILLDNNRISCFTENGVCEIDYKNKKHRELKANKKMISNPILGEGKKEVFGYDINGSLISFHLELDRIESIKLGNELLQHPVSIENQIFAASANHLHQVEI